MRSAACQHENPADAKFCLECGARLMLRCEHCGADLPPEAKFCLECGTRVSPAGVALRPAAEAPSEEERTQGGERRQLTVLFSDLVGSTELASGMDPEEWRAVAAEYERTAAETIARFGGHVAKFLGDGVLAYFGWPVAHDDAPERAVRAGLALRDGVTALRERLDVRLAVRVAMHTGTVVVGAGGEVYGEVPNVAARVQTLAEPHSVVVTAATHRLVAGTVLVEDAGRHELKGLREPVRVYRVVAVSGVRGPLALAAARGLTPFVGREQERRLLLERWEQVQEGDGQVVLIVGEPGIGKSRLVQQFKADLGGTPHSWFEAAGSPYHSASPFYLVREGVLLQAFGWAADISVEERLEGLAQALELAGLRPAEAVPLLAPLLDLGLPPGRYPPLMLPPEQERRRLIATLVQWVLASARLQPIIIVTENLQWVDPSTLDLLGLLGEQGATAPVLLIHTMRPEFRTPWPLRSHHTQVTLNRLTRKHARQMIASVTAETVPSKELMETLIARADGVPLFVEELTRAVGEGAAGAVTPSDIPATLQDSLMARLDRLGPAKEVAQVAAVIGREFSYSLLHAVAHISEGELQSALERLADAELVYARGLPPEATYLFKHALVQDAAYGALLKARRRELHRAVAETLARRTTEPEVVAQHWEAAGEAERAAAAWMQAGERALERGAEVEAERHYTRAAEAIATLPETPARAEQELAVQLALGRIFGSTRGWASPEAARAETCSRELIQQVGDTQALLRSLLLTFTSMLTRGDLRAALGVSEQFLEAAARDGSTFALTYTHAMHAVALSLAGDLAGADEHSERALGFYRPEDYRAWPSDAGIVAQSVQANTLCLQGFADRSHARVGVLLERVKTLEMPGHRAFALSQAVLTLGFLRDPAAILVHSEPLLALAAEHHLPVFHAWGRIMRGWALATLGRTGEGIADLRAGIEAYATTGGRIALGRYLGLVAEVELAQGRVAEGLGRIEQALAAVPEERVSLPELLRVRGELRAASGAERAAVEADLRQAIALSREMGARQLELRATTSLARQLRAGGRAGEGRELLAPLYAWFTEGFGTADLRDAKALLEELG